MKKVIVTTTINRPTAALEKFQALADWELVVIGDLKTPADYRLKRGIYVPPAEQEKYDPLLSEAIGWNCVQRRNFGLLWAADMQAEVVAVVDDDNIPLDAWGRDLLLGKEVEMDYYETDLSAFDPVGATNYPRLWHRGFPLQLLPRRDYSRKTRRKIAADVQADFWNGAPDVDAVCRMVYAPQCTFDAAGFPVAANRPGPFSTQNTFLGGACLADYFLFPHVGRMDDIWASYYLQAKGYRVVWNKASVYQDRNPHDSVQDMRQEYLGYERNLELVESLARDAESIRGFLPASSLRALELYRRHFATATRL
jgi:hypothetical protein